MKERIVCIEWDDACFNQGYYNESEPERFEQVRTRSVGFIVKSTSKEVILSSERNYVKEKIDGDRHINTIPKKMIKRIVQLKGAGNHKPSGIRQ